MKITREELIVLVGAGAIVYPEGWRGVNPYRTFLAKDLDYVRKGAIRIIRRRGGNVEVVVSRYGKSTI